MVVPWTGDELRRGKGIALNGLFPFFVILERRTGLRKEYTYVNEVSLRGKGQKVANVMPNACSTVQWRDPSLTRVGSCD